LHTVLSIRVRARRRNRNCVRTASEPPRNPGATPALTGTRRRASTLGKSTIRKCVGGVSVRQHARVESISNRAPATFGVLSRRCLRTERLDGRGRTHCDLGYQRFKEPVHAAGAIVS
jgi:hypothetical protein